MIKLDLKDAYFMVPIAPQHQKLQWEGRNFHFTCLPFGLSTAPRTFTKVTKTVVSILRSRGVRMVVYLDDIIFLLQREEKLTQIRNLVLDFLGYLVNYKKSELSLSTEPRLHNRFSVNGNQSPQGEGLFNNTGGSEVNSVREDINKTAGSHDRGILVDNPSGPPCPPPLQRATIPETQGPQNGRILLPCDVDRRSQRRSPVVGPPSSGNEWSAHSERPPLTNDYNRCLTSGVGGPLPGLQDLGSMDRGREDSSPGVTRCVPGSESILQGEEGHYSPPETRQLHSNCLHQPPRGDKIISTVLPSN